MYVWGFLVLMKVGIYVPKEWNNESHLFGFLRISDGSLHFQKSWIPQTSFFFFLGKDKQVGRALASCFGIFGKVY